jgi:hypothetical protein
MFQSLNVYLASSLTLQITQPFSADVFRSSALSLPSDSATQKILSRLKNQLSKCSRSSSKVFAVFVRFQPKLCYVYRF